jgi:hypothetical protein
MLIAMIPSKGADTGSEIAKVYRKILQLCRERNIRVIAGISDGAASERQAQKDLMSSSGSRISYNNKKYGIDISAPDLPGTGPFVAVQDAKHAKKTLRNNLQSGAKTMGLGKYLLNFTLLDKLLGYQNSGLVKGDLYNADKQDDGAAGRLFHSQLLKSMVNEREGFIKDESMVGLFIYLFIFGKFHPVSF